MMQKGPRKHVSDGRAIVVGAGIGGLAAAVWLRAAGLDVTVLEAHDSPGGKLRAVASDAGPVDAGPTVLTLKPVFDELCEAAGCRLDDALALSQEPLLARHFWPDGSRLDLTDTRVTNAEAIGRFAGPAERDAFNAFSDSAEALFAMFDAPMMQAPDPALPVLALQVLRNPGRLFDMLPGLTLQGLLERHFSDPRLRQLFGRYATYVGGSPAAAPALLSLIWEAEARGVWQITGGIHKLAELLADRLRKMGAVFRSGCAVARLDIENGDLHGVTLQSGETIAAQTVVFNGDPRALALGKLGPNARRAAPALATRARSHSAHVWSFAATVQGPELAHHNVFFAADPAAEFADLARGEIPQDPSIYICAQDRGTGMPPPSGPERFEIILNAPPLADGRPRKMEVETCRQQTFSTLERFGLHLSPWPTDSTLTGPAQFEAMFPGSAGSLYGQSPHGMTSALTRPRARTPIRGLYLAGGGTHPGPGLPMAALSGRHAAQTVLADLGSTFMSARTAMPGGISTGSATTEAAPSR